MELAGRGAEGLADVVGALDRDADEVRLAGGLVVGHRAFVEMADVVKFVAVGEPRVARRAEEIRARVLADRAGRVEVAVGFLRGGNLGNECVEIPVQLMVRVRGERLSGPFDDLEDIRVVERRAAKLAGHEFAGLGEVINAPRLFALLKVIPDGALAVGLEAR